MNSETRDTLAVLAGIVFCVTIIISALFFNGISEPFRQRIAGYIFCSLVGLINISATMFVIYKNR